MRTVVLVDDVHIGTVRVVEFAKSLGRPWVGLHVDYSDRKTSAVQKKWAERIGEGQLIVLSSPYRKLYEPISEYICAELEKDPERFVHVIMGQLIMDTPFTRALHSNNSLGIMSELQKHDRVVVTEVPYQLHEHEAATRPPPASSDYQQMMDHIDAHADPAAERAP